MGLFESQYTSTSLQAALGQEVSGGGCQPFGLCIQILSSYLIPWSVLIQHKGPSRTRFFFFIAAMTSFPDPDELIYPRNLGVLAVVDIDF